MYKYINYIYIYRGRGGGGARSVFPFLPHQPSGIRFYLHPHPHPYPRTLPPIPAPNRVGPRRAPSSRVILSSLVKLAFFTVSLENHNFLQTTSNIHIIYRWKEFFATSIDSRSLPQNKVPIGSDQLSKFCYFVRKSVPTIRALLS